MNAKEAASREGDGLGFCWGTWSWKTETGGGVKSDQVKRLSFIQCLNIRLKVATT